MFEFLKNKKKENNSLIGSISTKVDSIDDIDAEIRRLKDFVKGGTENMVLKNQEEEYEEPEEEEADEDEEIMEEEEETPKVKKPLPVKKPLLVKKQQVSEEVIAVVDALPVQAYRNATITEGEDKGKTIVYYTTNEALLKIMADLELIKKATGA